MTIPILTTDVRTEHDVLLTRQRARQIAQLLGFDTHDQTRVATAVSEIARFAVQHAGGGKVAFLLEESEPQSYLIHVTDATGQLARWCASVGVNDESLRGMRRLMDTCRIASLSASDKLREPSVILSKLRRRLPLLTKRDVSHITLELAQPIVDNPLAEMQRQNQELLKALDEREQHLEEIETLNRRLQRSIQATHHRVKNNLQIISALVELQTDEGEETVPVAAMSRIGRHVRALAALHDLLTEETKEDGEAGLISVKAAMNKLIPLLQATTGGHHITYYVEDFLLTMRDGASLVLLVAEIVSNALKHGRREVKVTLKAHNETAHLEVCNDGPGFPVDFDWRKSAKTGLGLINSTGRHDLHGTILFDNPLDGGARVSVTFPITNANNSDL